MAELKRHRWFGETRVVGLAGPGSQISVEEWRGQQTFYHVFCCCFFNAEHVEQYSVTVH